LPAPDASDDLRLLEDTVREAGKIALRFYGGDYKRWSKEGGSPVTEADLAVNTFLHDRLTAARPGYGWLSEESADDPARLTRDKVFVIDPIDGTIAFLKNRPHFTICAAVVIEGRPCCGAVYMHVQTRNSVAYRIVLVADGSADASVSLSSKRDWDLAAADIILTEAGGRLSDAQGGPLIYNRPVTRQPSLAAANPALHSQIVSLLRQK
jgi:myo-inositol-1(or 4)-monophosphatase